MPHVHISNTPSSTNVIVELNGLLQASKQLQEILSASGERSKDDKIGEDGKAELTA